MTEHSASSTHDPRPLIWSISRSRKYTLVLASVLVVLFYILAVHRDSFYEASELQRLWLNAVNSDCRAGSSTLESSQKHEFYYKQTPEEPKAIIIESVLVPNTIPLILHFAGVLGPRWGIILFVLEETWSPATSAPLLRLQKSGQVEIRFLPAGTVLTDSRSVSRFLTLPWLWEQTVAAERVLMFQADSILCSASEQAVDDYLAYDLVGAPIHEQYGRGYNGGLSLRNPRAYLNITKTVDFASSGHGYEDQFFYEELLRNGARLPETDVAKRFSVETIYYETPLGYHQPQRWQGSNMPQIEQWCPEVNLLVGRRAQ